MDLGSQAAGIGTLADETRRALYEYVAAQPEAVGREQAATALGLAMHNVVFHLDRLVAQGLLEVEYRRLSGKSGPGAGRPSKLYRRAADEFSISLPPRRYDLAGEILAAAVARAEDGVPLDQAVRECARREGLAAAQAQGLDRAGVLENLAQILDNQGFEPRVDDDEMLLANCPFHALAQKHTELVCGLNLAYVQGAADGIAPNLAACLEPEPGRCCVRVRAAEGG